MASQTPSYNPEERNSEIDPKIPPLLETLEKKLYKIVRKMGEKSNIKDADRVYVNMELVHSGRTYSMQTGKAFFENNKGEDVGKCYFIVNDFLTNDIICRTAENKYYEIRDYEQGDIEKITRDLSNIINEQKGSSNSPYWLILYADIKGINSSHPLYTNPKIEKIELSRNNTNTILIKYYTTRSDIHMAFIPLQYQK